MHRTTRCQSNVTRHSQIYYSAKVTLVFDAPACLPQNQSFSGTTRTIVSTTVDKYERYEILIMPKRIAGFPFVAVRIYCLNKYYALG